jgi:thiamine-monophosphate kinase
MAGHHFDFVPRVREALLLHQKYELHAGTDISDGLSLDAARVAAESECGAVIWLGQVPISKAALALPNPIEHALGDGEDFELLLAASPDAADAILQDQAIDCSITCLGELIAEPGLWQQTALGKRSPLQPTGWQH